MLGGRIARLLGRRGELRPGADLSIIAPALAGCLLQRVLVFGEPITDSLVERVVDHVILPAATGRCTTSLPGPTPEKS